MTLFARPFELVSEYLVHIRVDWPHDGDELKLSELSSSEEARRAELIESGHLRRLWRDPGKWANWTVWEVTDATELHKQLTSLPLYPWMRIRVHPLARHEADPGAHAQT